MEVKNPVATYEVLDETEASALKEDDVDENANDIDVKITPMPLDKPTVIQQQDQTSRTSRKNVCIWDKTQKRRANLCHGCFTKRRD